uniref:Uncharacterized protein n=1 Tax=Chromera velia CCMP2878 TaxID=1169474 RepID=A0A0G4G4K4_9ALVE|eukprot:Cvel_574.t1-p1 / transcript=Cvel_574.t1 / gene=Cvel_574 / organism=Chromera_velia_CCMP2878 / gene_product=Mitochondrial substrate carrier family protein N, putative / transcript_product=Mitochondrial substrate carrier family protein N, putative / location=Cvel_scaffold17:220480-223739(-) / protein_length=954 / sequence_SO=supercontig / SO=protein_coding / is_pseudo=false
MTRASGLSCAAASSAVPCGSLFAFVPVPVGATRSDSGRSFQGGFRRPAVARTHLGRGDREAVLSTFEELVGGGEGEGEVEEAQLRRVPSPPFRSLPPERFVSAEREREGHTGKETVVGQPAGHLLRSGLARRGPKGRSRREGVAASLGTLAAGCALAAGGGVSSGGGETWMDRLVGGAGAFAETVGEGGVGGGEAPLSSRCGLSPLQIETGDLSEKFCPPLSSEDLNDIDAVVSRLLSSSSPSPSPAGISTPPPQTQTAAAAAGGGGGKKVLEFEGLLWEPIRERDSPPEFLVLFPPSSANPITRQYPPQFTTYLTRLLLTYDDHLRNWWLRRHEFFRQQLLTLSPPTEEQKQRNEAAGNEIFGSLVNLFGPSVLTAALSADREISRAAAAYERTLFGELAGSLQLGLEKEFGGRGGIPRLAEILLQRYGAADGADSRRQFALLFALLPRGMQPLSVLDILCEGLPTVSRPDVQQTQSSQQQKQNWGGKEKRGEGEDESPVSESRPLLRSSRVSAWTNAIRDRKEKGPFAYQTAAQEQQAMLNDPLLLLPPSVLPYWDTDLRAYALAGLRSDPAAALPLSAVELAEDPGAPPVLKTRRTRGSDSANAAERQAVLTLYGLRGAGPLASERPLSTNVYGLFAVAGACACAATHTAVTPLDVVKTRMQTQPGRFSSLSDGLATIFREEGPKNLFAGATPTLLGYLSYGLVVYPGYEFCKRLLFDLAGPVGVLEFRNPLVILAGAMATVFACFAVSPFEAVRIRLVDQPGFATGFLPALQKMAKTEGWTQLYAGLPPLMGRQVLFGMCKFFIFDSFARWFFETFPGVLVGSEETTRLLVSALAGLVAGVCSACVSQPADAVVSFINKGKAAAATGQEEGTLEQGDKGGNKVLAAIKSIWKDFGPAGFFFGLGSRCAWSGSIISGQFFLYDAARAALQVQASDLKMNLNVLADLALPPS